LSLIDVAKILTPQQLKLQDTKFMKETSFSVRGSEIRARPIIHA